MRVGHFVPAYRSQVHAEVAMSLAREAAWCESKKWTHVPFYVDATGIARARNIAVEMAYRSRCDLLLMQDSDCFALPDANYSAIAAMWRSMHNVGGHVLGLAIAVRNGDGMNCEPANPGHVYEGDVGTGLMLIDLRPLRDLPRPWFRQVDSASGDTVECGEDINFCRHVRAHGYRVWIDYTIPTGHASSTVIGTYATQGGKSADSGDGGRDSREDDDDGG